MPPPERRVIFDINDLDKTLPAPWEWDVERLAASFVLRTPAASLIAVLALAQAALGVVRSVRTVGFVAAAVNLLLASNLVIQGEPIVRALVWCVVPVVIVCYLLAEPSRPIAEPQGTAD